MTENLTQDPDFVSYHHSRTRASSYDVFDVRKGGNALSKYRVGNQTHEYHQDVDDIPQVSEGQGGTTSEPLCTELVDTEPTPNESLEVEGVTDASEKAEYTPRYYLRPCPGTNVWSHNRIIYLLVAFSKCRMYFWDCVYICYPKCYFTGGNLTELGRIEVCVALFKFIGCVNGRRLRVAYYNIEMCDLENVQYYDIKFVL